MNARPPRFVFPEPARPPGFVLLAVLIVVMLGSMVALSLLFRMKAEESAANATVTGEKAWDAALSGVYHAMHVAASLPISSLAWQNAPGLFQHQFLVDDGSDQWFFSIYNSDPGGDGQPRYGLNDEAGKININHIGDLSLDNLPQFTPALSQSLLDFIDPDQDTRPESAEQTEYLALGRNYAVRNGPLSSLGELMLVRGFSPPLLYGADSNLLQRLGVAESDTSSAADSDASAPAGAPPESLDSLLTVWSYDLNLDSKRQPRININDSSQALTNLDLPDAVLSFLQNLRTNRVTVTNVSDLLDMTAQFKDAKGRMIPVDSGVGKQELPVIMDRLTAANATRLYGLINVNTAPVPVLAAVPGIDVNLAESIAAARAGLDPDAAATTAWLFTQGLVDAAQFKKIAPHLTARSFQFSFRVVGYSAPSGQYRVLEAVIDAAANPPVIAYLRDLTRLGLPYKLNLQPDDKSG